MFFFKEYRVSIMALLIIIGLLFSACDGSDSDDGDQSSLTIVDFFPLDKATDIPINVTVSVVFSDTVDASTIIAGVSFSLASSSETVSGDLIVEDRTVYFKPDNQLQESTLYVVTMGAAISSTSGHSLGEDYSFSFTTGIPVKVSSMTFKDGHFDRFYSDYNQAFSDTLERENVDISTWIRIEFSESVEPSSVTTERRDIFQDGGGLIEEGSVYLRRISVGNNSVLNTELPEHIVIIDVVSWEQNNTSVTVKALNQHFTGADTQSEGWYGVKPGSTYQLFLTDDIKTPSGAPLDVSTVQNLTWTTTEVDWGLYFISAKSLVDGYVYSEKFVPGRINEWFQPAERTVFWTHGFESQSTLTDYRRETLLYNAPEGEGTTWNGYDTAQSIIGDGWNFGIFYWDQYADEPTEVKDCEAKIWNALKRGGDQNNGRYGTRYALQLNIGEGAYREPDDPAFHGSPDPLAIQVYKQYLAAMAGNTAEKRLVGHSNGGQLFVPVAWLITRNIKEGTIDSAYALDRLVLQDAFWSRNEKGYFSDPANSLWGYGQPKVNGDVVCDYVDDMKTWNSALAIQQSKFQNFMNGDFTALGIEGFIGDDNFQLRRKTCIVYIYPAWVPDNAVNTPARHRYGKLYYFWTYEQSIHDFITTHGGVTARTDSSIIRSFMNNGSNDRVFYQIEDSHRNTPYPGDNEYELQPLGIYW